MVKLKRAYEPAQKSDGYRVLVERLWPRGLRKEDLALDEWLKDVAPSTELRKWFGHDPEKWSDFQKRYRDELKAAPAADALRELKTRAAKETVTLLFSSHDEEHNNAVVLWNVLTRRVPARRRAS